MGWTILEDGQVDEDHRKAWVIDQVWRLLAGDRHEQIIDEYCDGEMGKRRTVTYGDRAVTVVMRQREPLDLHQVDDNSCLTCVAANVLYVLGVTDTLDTRWVDREVGREPGCGAQRAGARRFLLQQGLSLHMVCAYEPERFLQEGFDYLRRYYRQEWDSSWNEYWTRHRLERHRHECLAAQELSTFGARMRTEHRQPTLADIRGALDRGRLVWVSVDNDWGKVDCHAVLVYGQRGNVFDVYSPENSRSCLQQYRRRRLDRVWLRSEGMTAVWRREPWRGARCIPSTST